MLTWRLQNAAGSECNQVKEANSNLDRPIRAHKFVSLDAFRGAAALAVVLYHISSTVLPGTFSCGYLAVDFFFMLSGFVLTYAYQDRLDAGLSTFAFTKLRIARLYPLYALGIVLGASFELTQVLTTNSGHSTPATVFVLTLLGLALAPVRPGALNRSLASFPLNEPAWSLVDEIVVNVLHALLGRTRSVRFFTSVAAVAWLITATFAFRHGSINFGVRWTQFFSGIVRTIFGYCVGILLFRLWRSGRFKITTPLIVPISLLMAVFVPSPPARWLPYYDLTVVTLLLPSIVLLGASSYPPKLLVGLFEKLGIASYAVYILHVPIFAFFERIWNHSTGHEASFNAPWSGLLFLLLVAATALIADRFYDLPVRSILQRTFLTSGPKT